MPEGVIQTLKTFFSYFFRKSMAKLFASTAPPKNTRSLGGRIVLPLPPQERDSPCQLTRIFLTVVGSAKEYGKLVFIAILKQLNAAR